MASYRTPDDVVPDIGCWFWTEEEFQPQGYRPFIDKMAAHSPFKWLTTSIRAPEVEVTDPAVHDQINAATLYARERGIGIGMDLDVRLARRAFQQRYPDEMQEMLRLRETTLDAGQPVSLKIESAYLNDHYTHRTTPYVALAGRLERVYACVKGPEGIEPDTLEDITADCRVSTAEPAAVEVELPADARRAGPTACVIVAFTHFAPDVFAPHLLEFQREILRQYADVPLVGACKDEWGFPPCFDGCPEKNDYWFSPALATAYAEHTDGRDLVRDCLLMYAGEQGRQGSRQRAINHYQEMSLRRNSAVEGDFYRTVKEIWGEEAAPATHPTWYPFPGVQEFMKNGLDWWSAPRDLAQTDEVTPYCCRTSLAKKWNSSLWVNMYYATSVADYERDLWRGALTGGRINFHPLYPVEDRSTRHDLLLQGGLMRGACRVRLLNFISAAPLECPVAVVFGHWAAMNWAGTHYGDAGVAMADAFWRAGYPADLIPSSEMTSAALRIGEDGHLHYGPQRYQAVVLYHPQFEGEQTEALLQQMARPGKTWVVCIGEWTADFTGRPFRSDAALAGIPLYADPQGAARAVIEHLQQHGVLPQTPAGETMPGFSYESAAPPRAGRSRLLDGTHLLIAGEKQVEGDPIRGSYDIDGREISVEAAGVVGVRFDTEGHLVALAAGALRRFQTDGFRLALEEPIDLALWRDEPGRWWGVVQDLEGELPPALTALTKDWRRLAVPPPLPDA